VGLGADYRSGGQLLRTRPDEGSQVASGPLPHVFRDLPNASTMRTREITRPKRCGFLTRRQSSSQCLLEDVHCDKLEGPNGLGQDRPVTGARGHLEGERRLMGLPGV